MRRLDMSVTHTPCIRRDIRNFLADSKISEASSQIPCIFDDVYQRTGRRAQIQEIFNLARYAPYRHARYALYVATDDTETRRKRDR